ncbi:NUDIX domain-containing protein [Paenibacillus spiritus]|uniref:NUDIX domain-containing protein n=1 Tax=Paenibacillus spiritus TaxID=2496557 RepID=A0A5J5GEX6_9BACL|nr:NUDIX domain-containing protein [Paenibacillus spiritus]KAA9006358.1 NUDIX domain-containing protein [Paenibacillus spiritus]
MASQEQLDILDRQGRVIGQDTREQVHSLGLWHQTFHCWVLDPDMGAGGSLLFQLRHPSKDTFGGLLDISCAGHLLAGEEPKDGVRELREELGLAVAFEDLLLCGTIAEESLPGPGLIDREFSHVYLYVSDRAVESYDFQKEEISGLFFIGVEDITSLLRGERESLDIRGVLADEASGVLRPERRVVRPENFTPNSAEYYRLLFQGIGKL